MADTRYVYGARCTWHGPIVDIGTRQISYTTPGGVPGQGKVPCCPHCGGMLFEYDKIEDWRLSVSEFDKKHPGYAEFVDWVGKVGRCWPNYIEAIPFYTLDTGKVPSWPAKK